MTQRAETSLIGKSTTSRITSSLEESSSSSWVMSVIESRGSAAGEVGVAALDLQTCECHLSQFADTPTFAKTVHKIHLVEPLELLMSITTAETSKSNLCAIIEELLPNIPIVPVHRKYYNDGVGLNYLKRYGLSEETPTIAVTLSTKYYCLAALAALLKYVEVAQNMVFPNHTIRFKYLAADGLMMIDSVTCKNLELVTNLTNPKTNHSLFGILDHTKTPMGARLLRTNIMQPITDEVTLETRLNAVEELIQSEEQFYSIQNALKDFVDVDRLIGSLVLITRKPCVKTVEISINNIIALKHSVTLLGPLVLSLAGSNNEVLQTVSKVLSSSALAAIKNRIDEVINKDVTYQKSPAGLRNQRCYAIKAGFNGLLDVARKTYREGVNDVHDLCSSYAEKYQLPIKAVFSPSVGYQLTVSRESADDWSRGSKEVLPNEFINVVTKKKQLQFSTLDLISCNDRIHESLTEVYLMSDKTVAELLDFIRDRIGCLYKASECLALLDMLVSFAHYSTITQTVRPEYTGTLAIKSGRHPIRESVYCEAFVPNDTYASDDSSFQVITGPNMSGKSTYLRQVALLTIMAHLGTFMPAEYASFRITDKVFTRIGNDDIVEANASTFMMECREVAYIVNNVSDCSLVIIDELGRGTSTTDGAAVALAVAEALLRTKAFVLFATHFHTLVPIITKQSTAVAMHLGVKISEDTPNESDCADQGGKVSISYTYVIKEGCSSDENYGIWLAQLAGFPDSVLSKAAKISRKVDINRKRSQDKDKEANTAHRSNIIKLARRIIQLRKSAIMSAADVRQHLALLQQNI
ncbi:muts protein 4 [Cladochytrium replicatum]|nr:muts protein 4 [Cladochytrium replicatum]